ncbi:hypothetical protein Agub_g6708, partial [Astrephomene gubernaculifera]
LTHPSQPHVVRTKALLALSGLVRHFAPGLQALRDAGGLSAIISCLTSPDRRLARKAMTTLSYILTQRQADCTTAHQQGALPPLLAALGLPSAAAEGAASTSEGDADASGSSSQEDSDFRQAALGALLQLAGHPDTWAVVREAPGLRPRLAELEA